MKGFFLRADYWSIFEKEIPDLVEERKVFPAHHFPSGQLFRKEICAGKSRAL